MNGRVARAAVVLAAVLSWASHAAALPGFAEVRRGHRSSEAVLLDRNGVPLHELRVEDRFRRLPWVALDEVSQPLLEAVVRAEDKRFFEHGGVDWRALGDATIDTVVRGSPRGASTLTMQVAAMLEPTLRPEGSRRTVGQKWEQIKAARALEAAWSKAQILEAYLNLSEFRGELNGVAAASRGLFGKVPADVDAREAAILAALLRGPNAKPALVARRACQLAAEGECEAIERLVQQRLGGPPRFEPGVALAPHLARELLSREAPRVMSTLDARVQRAALDALSRQLAQLAGRGVRDAAAIVLDNASGEVLAYVGNTGRGSTAPFVDGVKAPRQAGSTLKPFLYELALEQQVLTAASLLDDSPANLVTPSGLYVPQNYDREFRGLASVRTSLAASLNVPAVRTLMLVGTERFANRLRELEFGTVQESGDYYGLALALGSAEVTLWDLTNAYRALANGGTWSRPRVLPAPAGRAQRVLDPAASFVVADILADRAARSVSFGLESPLATRFWSAVKTGTSKDMRDNWCVGFSSRYTVGVWVGNFDGAPMRDVSGVSGAAPAWLEIMAVLHRGDSRLRPPARPADVVEQRVRFTPQVEAERTELFLRGTEVAEVVAKPDLHAAARIVYPAEGSVLAIDPDIPQDSQRIRFEASAPEDGLTWLVNGDAIDTRGEFGWAPVPGRHELTLVDASGRVLDRVHFAVRGASPP